MKTQMQDLLLRALLAKCQFVSILVIKMAALLTSVVADQIQIQALQHRIAVRCKRLWKQSMRSVAQINASA
jgi:hypothetical protein